MGKKNEKTVTNTAKAAPIGAVAAPEQKIGLANRANYDLTVVHGKDVVVVPPHRRTAKQFYKSQIKSVNGVTLSQALSRGMTTIIN